MKIYKAIIHSVKDRPTVSFVIFDNTLVFKVSSSRSPSFAMDAGIRFCDIDIYGLSQCL